MNAQRTDRRQRAAWALALALVALALLMLSLIFTRIGLAAPQTDNPMRPLITNVGADIVTDTTWTLAGSPYILVANITVHPGVTLTIEPGVVVRGGESTELRIRGHLQAVGTATQPITFTSVTDTWPGWWDGLLFDGGTGNLRYATVRYAGNTNTAGFRANITARNVLTGQVRLESGQVRSCWAWHGSPEYGMVVADSRVVVSDTLFTGIGDGGGDAALYITGADSTVILQNDTIAENRQYGVHLASGGQVTMTQVSLARNGSHGVLVDGDTAMLRMTRSGVILNRGDGVRNTGAAQVILGGAPGTGNDILANTDLGVNQVGTGGEQLQPAVAECGRLHKLYPPDGGRENSPHPGPV